MGTVAVIVAVNSTSAVTQNESSKMQLARRYLSKQRYEQAIIEFKKVIKSEPTNVDAYLGLADAYIGADDDEKAREILDEGFEITGDERIQEKIDELKNFKKPEVSSSSSSVASSTSSILNLSGTGISDITPLAELAWIQTLLTNCYIGGVLERMYIG